MITIYRENTLTSSRFLVAIRDLGHSMIFELNMANTTIRRSIHAQSSSPGAGSLVPLELIPFSMFDTQFKKTIFVLEDHWKKHNLLKAR
jgi:hypothetical protein